MPTIREFKPDTVTEPDRITIILVVVDWCMDCKAARKLLVERWGECGIEADIYILNADRDAKTAHELGAIAAPYWIVRYEGNEAAFQGICDLSTLITLTVEVLPSRQPTSSQAPFSQAS